MVPLPKVKCPYPERQRLILCWVLMLLNYIFHFREKRVNWDFLG